MGLKKSTAMLKNFDLSIADEITRSEVSVNEMEVDIENECTSKRNHHQSNLPQLFNPKTCLDEQAKSPLPDF
jgi:phosphate uptake regulator